MGVPETGALERPPQPKTRIAGSETGAPTYSLRGRFASRHAFTIREELTVRDEPALMPQLPRWYSLGAFLIMSSATIFTMCAMGRPGA
ncbi:hypothetical protein [Sphingobium yanoikuyae]|uniref:Uncharacterized protein n=1 Tax=Sphingobium yanoikuyae TaxID=13690 RepID=A0A291N6X1_SPHYA|nr:hypothetical protein [Sphingobium yanoikuyae]ATI82890.1 hypothetical protein A6768_24740 [Sphingobium yanoikuyae]